jgi:hypothetical protein
MTKWYGHVRHSKRFWPTYCSIVGSPGGTRETRSMLLQVGQTGGLAREGEGNQEGGVQRSMVGVAGICWGSTLGNCVEGWRARK